MELILQQNITSFISRNGQAPLLIKVPLYSEDFYNEGLIYQRFMQNSKAIECFKTALIGEPMNLKILEALGKIFLAMGQDENARGHYQRVLNIIATSNDIDMQLKADIYHQFAQSCRELFDENISFGGGKEMRERLKEQSLSYLLIALQIRKDLLGIRHPAYAGSLILLGIICADSGRKIIFSGDGSIDISTRGYYPDEVLYCYNMALEIMQENFGKDHPNVGMIYHLIANIYYGQGGGRFPDSIRYDEKAIGILEKFYGYSYHPLCVGIKLNLGNKYLGTLEMSKAKFRNIIKARDTHQKVLQDLQSVFGKQGMYKTIAFAANNLSNAEFALQNYPASFEHSKLAYEIGKGIYGEDNDLTKKTAARMIASQDRLERLDSYFGIAFQVYVTLSVKALEIVLTDLDKKGEQLKEKGSYEEARISFLRIYNIIEC